jgi:hypothetical protein
MMIEEVPPPPAAVSGAPARKFNVWMDDIERIISVAKHALELTPYGMVMYASLTQVNPSQFPGFMGFPYAYNSPANTTVASTGSGGGTTSGDWASAFEQTAQSIYQQAQAAAAAQVNSSGVAAGQAVQTALSTVGSYLAQANKTLTQDVVNQLNTLVSFLGGL